MRLDTGVPVLHCGVAARAIPGAMVDIDSMYLLYLLLAWCIDIVSKMGKLCKL